MNYLTFAGNCRLFKVYTSQQITPRMLCISDDDADNDDDDDKEEEEDDDDENAKLFLAAALCRNVNNSNLFLASRAMKVVKKCILFIAQVIRHWIATKRRQQKCNAHQVHACRIVFTCNIHIYNVYTYVYICSKQECIAPSYHLLLPGTSSSQQLS